MKETHTLHPLSDGLSVSVVVYHPDTEQLVSTLTGLAVACDALHISRPDLPVTLYLVDNGGLPDIPATLEGLGARGIVCTIIAGQGNVGYGRGHNLAIEGSASRYHLVLNPDIDLASDALREALGDQFVDYYAFIKNAEIERFQSEISEWEQREYFEMF